MNETKDDLGLEFSPKLGVLTEFLFGLLIILVVIQGTAPFFGIEIIILVGIAMLLPLILFSAVIMIMGHQMKWTFDSKIGYLSVILTFSSLFLVDLIGQTIFATIALSCGVLIVMLSFWHFYNLHREIMLKEEDGAEGEI